MAKDLGEYRQKRDFAKTTEPAGKAAKRSKKAAPRFVIQQHDASSLHWDLRLEKDGVMVSWALPKGIPEHPKANRLAVHTEDHPLDYAGFEGVIPEGQYGAGTMEVWDRGTFDEEKFRKDEVIVVLHGERVQGRYVLFQTKGKNWMIHRMDPPSDPGREQMPEGLRPMTAVTGPLPAGEKFSFEIKWDGVRVLAYCEHGHLRLESRNGNDVSARYPELRPFGRSMGSLDVVLDGEVVAFGPDGVPSFELLQQRMHLGSEAAVRRAMKEMPVTFAIFDMLWLDGHSLMGLPYSDRRRLLEQLDLNGKSWRTPAAHDDGEVLLAATLEQGLEGVVAKRRDSTYEPGRRSQAWVKVKNRLSQEFVVGGWTQGEGGRASSLGALLVGVQGEGGLTFAGKVGSGFNEALLKDLTAQLKDLARPESPFSGRATPKGANFVEPELVAQVEFTEWTRSGTLRAPVFKGLRDDIDPADVVREPTAR
ncbi:MAG: bifunctional non-ous end joining protein LigD [Thermoleophilaceae bacterium]|nr:bifunctional non-ous end joining protein LigD [Thermoleophilaceae bacterium]